MMTAKFLVLCRRPLLHREANEKHLPAKKKRLSLVAFVPGEVMKEELVLLVLLLFAPNQAIPGI